MAPIKTAICSLLLLGLQQSVSALTFSSNNVTTPPYKNPNNPVEVRVEDLLGRMTIEDKMGQLMQGIILMPSRYLVLVLRGSDGAIDGK